MRSNPAEFKSYRDSDSSRLESLPDTPMSHYFTIIWQKGLVLIAKDVVSLFNIIKTYKKCILLHGANSRRDEIKKRIMLWEKQLDRS
jgi:hypothetical protein